MDNILVTVITMTYNKFERIKDTVASVLAQDYGNIEYIISDDGSNDFPDDLVRELTMNAKLSNVVIHKQEKNAGTVRNSIAAAKLAEGKYILFLSCGDVFYEKNTVSKVVKRFNQTKADVIAVSRIEYANNYVPIGYCPHLKALKEINSWKSNDQQYIAFITTHSWEAYSGSALYYSKSILEEFNYFDEKYVLLEDGPFIEKYLRKRHITNAFDIIGLWYETGGISSTLKINPLMQKDCQVFDRGDRSARKGQLGKFCDDYIDYLTERSYDKTKADAIKTMLKHPNAVLAHIKYKLKERDARKYDQSYLMSHPVSSPDYFERF